MPDIDDTTDNPQTPEELLVELAELHMRTHVSPLPKHPAAFGWQMTAGSQAAGFARALHALNEVAPEKAAEVAAWYQGPFGEGPDPMEHTDWTAQHVAGSEAVVDQWAQEAEQGAVEAQQATERLEKEQQAGQVEHDAIHKHFGLSYANYLVAPRSLLQSMPDQWQTQFVVLLEQLEAAFEDVPQAEAYDVTAGSWELLGDMTEAQLEAAGIKETRGNFDANDEPTDGPLFHREADGAELTSDDYGFVPESDPVPHYNRGRTRVQPSLTAVKEA